jgi:hypothetical protein
VGGAARGAGEEDTHFLFLEVASNALPVGPPLSSRYVRAFACDFLENTFGYGVFELTTQKKGNAKKTR